MRTAIWFALLAGSAAAQTSAPPAFEVASVKINRQYRPDDGSTWRSVLKTSASGVTLQNVPLRRIVAWAYDLQNTQIAGPAWIDSERYDILAKAGREASVNELRAMTQALLADRFHLQFHRETRSTEVWALSVAKGGHKLQPSDTEEISEQPDPAGGTRLRGFTLAEFVRNVANDRPGPPMVDMTGLTGRFECVIRPAKYRDAMQARLASGQRPTSEADMVLGFMQEMFMAELGLRVEARKAPVEFLVIDKAEQKPSEN